ncbi:MAG: hypothetical protein H6823_17955 [Planctomycetaceae bacterium]|nr:hypothetical protein [Planctomycetales bacterium]MCB9940127.1 hypothetical protein [Planctomycetaceae bacterium]
MPDSNGTSIASTKQRGELPLVLALRVLGSIDMLAFVAVVMPTAWIQWGHHWSGLGEFPTAPIASYLARSASALYALHGLMVVYMSLDVRRYWPLIRLLARLSIAHGIVMLSIDLAVGMPVWWTVLEGPAFAVTGLIVLATQYWGEPETVAETAGD